MDVLLTHCAGVDVHREVLAITVLIGSPEDKPQVIQFEAKTFTEDLEEAARRLRALGVTHVAMESTGIYWKPIYNVWHKNGLKITLANATHIKNVPGRKTDMKDSHWIAALHRNGLIRPSYIADAEFQELRALCRHRKSLVRDTVTVKNRLLKVLEDGNLKLAVVISDVFSGSGLKLLRAIAGGETRSEQLITYAGSQLKTSKETISKALQNCLTDGHVFRIRLLLTEFDFLNEQIRQISERMKQLLTAHESILERLIEIPGIERRLAETILGEATTGMQAFANERHFAAWAGVAPGNNESAGKKKHCGTRKGNPALKEALVQAAKGASRKRGTYFHAKHNALKFRLSSANKATVAIANRLARLIYHIIKDPAVRYKDIGPERVQAKADLVKKTVKKLEHLGYSVKLEEKQ